MQLQQLSNPSDKDAVYIVTFHSHASSLAAWKHVTVNAVNCNKDKELVQSNHVNNTLFY